MLATIGHEQQAVATGANHVQRGLGGHVPLAAVPALQKLDWLAALP